MTTEEKAKAYDEAKERMKDFLKEWENCGAVGEAMEKARKVFPELAESEDEKIRKVISDILRINSDEIIEILDANNVLLLEVCDWLEKQGEKGAKGNEREIPFSKPPLTLKHAKEVMGIEQKPAWSEEDERIYQSIMDDTVQENQLNDKQTNWLRNIKYRYFPQPKQEWSEEDEKTIDEAVECLENYAEYVQGGFSKQHVLDLVSRVESLKDRYTWKPSDEQMEYLSAAIEESNENPVLESLYKDLKKLRNE